MVIGITINNILRDHLSKLKLISKEVYDIDPIEPINPFELDKSFIKQEISMVLFNPNEETELKPVDEDISFDIYDLCYNQASFEIFSACEESVPGIIKRISKYAQKTKTNIIFLNPESSRSKCATLFFLSKNGFDLTQVVFPKTWNEYWKYCDVIITDNPKILKTKPKNKKSIKMENQFNIDYKSDLTIFNVEEIFDKIKLIKKTWNKKTK